MLDQLLLSLEKLPTLSLNSPLVLCLVTLIFARILWTSLRGISGYSKYDFKTFNLLPGPTPLPILGNSLAFLGSKVNLLPTLKDNFELHGRVLRWYQGSKPYVMVAQPKAAEVILSSSKHITKGTDYNFLHPWLGQGLLTSGGAKWHGRRKLLTPAFHFKILEDFLVIMNEQSGILVDQLQQEVGKANEAGTVDVFPRVALAALDIICESAMGRSVEAQVQEDSSYVNAIRLLSDLIFERAMSPWIWPDLFYNLLPISRKTQECLDLVHGFTDSVIQERKAIYADIRDSEDGVSVSGRKKRLAFLDLLIESSNDGGMKLSDADIREEVDTFMFEGHDTTAAGMAFALLLLAQHPEEQSRVFQELESIFGADQQREVTFQDLAKMKHLECCIKEALRMYPSVPIITRTIHEDVTLQGMTVPAGTEAMVCIFHLHRDPDQFPEPDKFLPGRFDTNSPRAHAYAHVPFSAGPRNCIGQRFALMEEKVVISRILRNFQLSTEMPLENLALLPELILKPRDGIQLKLRPRH